MQDLADSPLRTEFDTLAGETAGAWRLDALSRPIQRVVIDVEGRQITLLNGHLKSKHGEYERWENGERPARGGP